LHKEKFANIEEEYDKLAHQRGAIIQEIARIERIEESRWLFEDALFRKDHKKIDHARRKRCRKGSCKNQIAYCSDLIIAHRN